jgi:hypothetical protein
VSQPYVYLDANGKPLAVGMTVTIGEVDGAQLIGRVVRISEPDADYNDELGRAVQLGPDVFVEGTDPEPWEDRFSGRWMATGPWDDDSPEYQFDDVEVIPREESKV